MCSSDLLCVCAFSRGGKRTRPRAAQRDTRHGGPHESESGPGRSTGLGTVDLHECRQACVGAKKGKVAPGLHLCAELLQRIRLALVQGCR